MVYVQDINGKPMMPATRHGKVRRLLKDKKAVVVNTKDSKRRNQEVKSISI